ncbi:MAG: hypothetical protein RI554_09390 [Trueperaceae bacterium]|nr:hypothetical protein [Trueperaceae bacterium]
MNEPTLRIAHVALHRPNFKGDAASATDRSRAGLADLADAFAFDLVVPEAHGGVVQEAAHADAVAAELAADPPDLLLLQHVTFATGDLVAPLLRAAPDGAAPRVAVWALPEAEAGRGATGPLPFNALCGLHMTMSLLGGPEVPRDGAPVKWLYGAVDEARFRTPFGVTVAALRAVKALERATILRIGGTAPGFFALEERPAGLRGVTVIERPLADLWDATDAADDADVDARAEAGREGHDVEVDDATLRRGARIEAGLAALAEADGADALAVRCWPELPDRCDAMACAAMGTLAGAGTPAACEGDAMGALSMLALQAVARDPSIVMDLSDLDEVGDAVEAWHCGNAPAAWADPDGPAPRLTTHFNRDGVGPVRDETLRPGPATALRFVDEGRAAVVATGAFEGAVREGYDGVRGWWRAPVWAGTPLPAGRFLAELFERRVPHHLAFVHGDHAAAVVEACAWAGIEVLGVTPRPFPDALGGGAPPAGSARDRDGGRDGDGSGG